MVHCCTWHKDSFDERDDHIDLASEQCLLPPRPHYNETRYTASQNISDIPGRYEDTTTIRVLVIMRHITHIRHSSKNMKIHGKKRVLVIMRHITKLLKTYQTFLAELKIQAQKESSL